MNEGDIKKPSQSQWLLIAISICLLLAALISLREILMPFAIGALIAYLGDPLVDRLEDRGFSRTNGVIIVFGLFLGLLVLVIAVVAPLQNYRHGSASPPSICPSLTGAQASASTGHRSVR